MDASAAPGGRRPFGFALLAVLVTWYAVGCAALAMHYLWRVPPERRSLSTALAGAAAAALGAWAARSLWQVRADAARAVAAWGSAVIGTFVALFFAVEPLPDGTRPWGTLAAGCVLFAAITAGLARWVGRRLHAGG